MIQLAADHFHRANGDLGSNWTPIAFTGYDPLLISSNQVQNTTGADDQSGYTGTTWPVDQYSQVTIASATLGRVGVVVRSDPSGVSAACYALVWLGTSVVVIYKISSSGVLSSLAQSVQTFAVGSVLKLSVQGTTLNGFLNGTLVLTVDDSAITTGVPGIFSKANIGVLLDDWSGGDSALPFVPDSAAIIIRYQDFIY